ncbi:MAG: DUF6531 domain-containing protein, partial [Chlamydiia bacterium]
MKRLFFFLFLIPALILGKSVEISSEDNKKIAEVYSRCFPLIEEANKVYLTDQEGYFRLLDEAYEACREAVHLCDDLIQRTKDGRNPRGGNYFLEGIEKVAREDKRVILQQMDSIFRILAPKREEMINDQISRLQQERPRSLETTREIRGHLSKLASLYKWARLYAIDSEDKEIYQKKIGRLNLEIHDLYKYVAEQKELLSQEIFALKSAKEREPSFNFLESSALFSVTHLDNQAHGIYAGQFYRYKILGPDPITYVIVKVFKEGELLHEETISVPLWNTPSWDLYVIEYGMVYIPRTYLKRDFGIDLRLSFSWNPTGPPSLILSQKGEKAGYQVVYYLDPKTPLFESTFYEPPPWQLGVLKKPVLSTAVSYADNHRNSDPYLDTATFESTSEQTLDFPLLDEFVKELNSDPLLLAQYVAHEIALVDPFSRKENGVYQALGIQRSPLMTFLEKEGSPLEQCHLLVYLLRKAGFIAKYAVDGAVRLEDKTIAEYPWVLFYDGNKWVSLFPWLKEVQVEEGYDVYNILPDEFANSDRWIRHYLRSDPRIMEQIGPDKDDSAALLFLHFVKGELRKKGLNLSDVGMHRTLLKRQFSRWEDFPYPVEIKGYNFVDSIDVFATVLIEVFSRKHKEKKIELPIRLADLDTSTIPIHFLEEGSRHYLQVQDKQIDLDAEDRIVEIKIGYKIPVGKEIESYTKSFFIDKDTMSALCFHFGGANSAKTTQFFAEFSLVQEEQKKFEALLSFVGASYFEKCGRARKVLAELHKTPNNTLFAVGLAKISKSAPQLDVVWVNTKEDGEHRDFNNLAALDASSNEHQVIREIFDDPSAVSTVRLLQLAHLEHVKNGLEGDGFLILTPHQFAYADKSPEGAQLLYYSHLTHLDIKGLKEAAPAQWRAVANLFDTTPGGNWAYAYMTPGLVERKVSTFILSPIDTKALLSGKMIVLNGGDGYSLSDRGISTSSVSSWNLYPTYDTVYTPQDLFRNYMLEFPLLPYNYSPPISFYNLSSYQIQPPSQQIFGQHGGFGSYQPQYVPHFMIKIREEVMADITRYQLINEYKFNLTPPATSDKFDHLLGDLRTSDVRPEHHSLYNLFADPVNVVNGAFYLDDVDLSMSGPFPIELRRNYNSQNPINSPFGYGWKMNLNPFLIENDEKLYAAELDGTVIVYSYNDEHDRWEVRAEDNPELLNTSPNPYHSYFEDNVLYGSDGSKRFFDDGLLQKWVDNRGNTLTFTYKEGRLSRISSSTGEFFGLIYNYEGRVAEVYAREGRRVTYEYSNRGDLTRIILPNTAVIYYEYDQEHRVVRETRPHGKVTENRYDSEGRVIEQWTAAGEEQRLVPTATFIYNEGETVVTDGGGGQTIYKIKNKQIYEITDPVGGMILQTWVSGTNFRRLSSAVDKRGLVTFYEYDDRGNCILMKAEGEKRFAYNEKNLCVFEEIEDHKTVTTYDETFEYLPKRVETYVSDVLISYAAFDYDMRGRLIQEDRAGAITLFEYDDRGYLVKKVQWTGTDDPDVETTFGYNNSGQCVEVVSPNGIEKSCYDIMGNCIGTWSYSPFGKLISASYTGYDLNNAVIWKRGADRSGLCYMDRHASGDVKAVRQVLDEDRVAYSYFEHDSRGCQIKEVDPRGFITYKEYDPLMRLIRETKEGHTTQYTYEIGGLLESATTPMGAKTTQSYTRNGLVKEVVFPDETKNLFAYDVFGRVIEETKNGVTWKIDYDDLHGKVTRSEFEMGIQEVEEFDVWGNLIRFTDAAGYVTEKTYDHLGRIKTITNPQGEITSWSYQGNQVISVRPNGEIEITNGIETTVTALDGTLLSYTAHNIDTKNSVETTTYGDITTNTWKNSLGLPYKIQTGEIVTHHEYDPCGNCITIIDGEGRITRQHFDAHSRLTKKELPDGNVIEYIYDLDSNLIATHLPDGSTWVASYDDMHHKCSEELQTGDKISHHWEYLYEKGNLIKTVDPMCRSHTYGYDVLNRLTSEVIDGWHRLYTYDKRGLLKTLEEYKEEPGWLYSSKTAHSIIERAYNGAANL